MAKKPEHADQGRRWVVVSVLVALLAWTGLWGVVQLPITTPSQVVFFVLLFVAIASTVMSPVAYLNERFARDISPRDLRARTIRARRIRARFVRQSIWLALFVVIAGWLQTRRMLTITLALILMAVLALTETFLITREAPPDQ
jgi:hypothetical protein